MDIGDLTIKQARELASLFGYNTQNVKSEHPFTGKYVIARCYAAGVHAGRLISAQGDTAILENSRRLWSWTAKEGIALSGVAQSGIKNSKVDVVNPSIYLSGVCELIPCTKKAEESINDAK